MLTVGERRDADGNRETGTFRDGRLVQGQSTAVDGMLLDGEDCLSVSPDGRRVRGKFRHGVPHGDVTLRLPDDTVLRGRLARGHVQGQGTRTAPDGAVFRGSLEANAPVRGVNTLPEGGSEEGRFEDGRLVDGWRVDAQGLVTVVP